MSASEPTGGDFPAARLGIALFLLSSATVLFTLSLFKLLSFFIMPSLFFDLLFVGFPVGAFLGARYFRVSPHAFRATLWILQVVMVLSIAVTLACKHFDYLRAHLFEVRLHRLILQMGMFTAFFVPFFCAYGLSEYIGYQVGRRNLAGRMSLVYALYLFGAAFAYFFVELFLSTLGISHLLVISILLIVVASGLLAPRGWGRRVLVLEMAVLIAVLSLPGLLEAAFLRLYKGSGAQSTAAYREERRFEMAFQRWGRYSLTEIMRSPPPVEFAGFYNDLMQWEYAPEYGFTERSLGMIPINVAPRSGSIAIIGAGGGRQVRWGSQPWFDFERIVALELEPTVFDAVRGPLREAFNRVYEREDLVEPICHEARGYMENKARGERFDLIYLPSVGGYPQMMLEPGNMIRTVDAYKTLRDRLTDRGVLAIWYPAGLDPKAVLTRQYVRTLESETIGMKVRAYVNPDEFLILAARDPASKLPTVREIADFLTGEAPFGDAAPLRLPPNRNAIPAPFFTAPDPGFSHISDNQPFLAGNVRHIFSLGQVYTLFSLVGGCLFIVGVLLLGGLRRRGNPRLPGRSYWQVAGLSLLIGANFLVFEHAVILALFKKIYVFHDALVIGAVSFLILSGLGSILITPRLRPACQALGAVFVVVFMIVQPIVDATWLIALIAPVAFVTGSFFPALFEAAAHNPLVVFAMDAVGAGLGSMLAFFLPIAFGFHVFFPAAAAIFLLTVCMTYLFFRPTSPLDARPPDQNAEAVGKDGRMES